LISGVFPLIIKLFFNTKLENQNFILFAWFTTKFISDLFAFLYFKFYHGNIFPVFHISVIIENLLLVAYFNSFNLISKKTKIFLIQIPIIIFIFESCFYSSILELNKISILTYNFSIAVLMMKLMLNSNQNIIKNNFILLVNILLFHSISFVYFLFEQIRRFNEDITFIVYPIYVCFIVTLNIYYSFFLWSRRKI
jgi:hypothetical protein